MLESLYAFVRETALLESILSVLGFDERTQMPPAAGPYRAEQNTYLAGKIHARRTDPQLGEWLQRLSESELASDPHSDAGATIRWLALAYEKQRRIPQELAEALARTTSLAEQSWAEARREGDFASFLPHLNQVIELKRQQAAAYGFEASPYDPLLDDYEPGETTANVAQVLGALRDELVPFAQSIFGSRRRPDTAILTRQYPRAAQEAFCREITAAIGYDFRAGQIAVTPHPYCATLGPRDVRITTRYDESFLATALFGSLHEAGHALYEQGLRDDWYGLPPGSAVSLGIHESQSRMWENQVGRSREFWQHFYSRAQAAFPTALGGIALADFHFAINDVKPSLIRVEADEITYNLHILIRFELEQAIIDGSLEAVDIPDAWDAKYQEYLGIAAPDLAAGCLQDVHWSAGLFGYFPTYALGNLYAAQFYAQAAVEIDDLDGLLSNGEFGPLREWLRKNIHAVGQCYSASELVEKVTGQPLSHAALMAYLRGRFAPLYGL